MSKPDTEIIAGAFLQKLPLFLENCRLIAFVIELSCINSTQNNLAFELEGQYQGAGDTFLLRFPRYRSTGRFRPGTNLSYI
jgi:hypothetical protein